MAGKDNLPTSYQADVDAVNSISAVPSILEVVCRTTGMGFAAIARVTEDSWIACAVRDEIGFGLVPAGELKIETNICHEIRQNQQPVIIDHVSEDKIYACHHTPAMYGFESYIPMPIIRKNGSMFGTLCAIDPRPARLNNPQTIGMFRLFSELIAFHLDAIDQLLLSESNLSEERKTAELGEQFIAILGHDLRNPVGAVANVVQPFTRGAGAGHDQIGNSSGQREHGLGLGLYIASEIAQAHGGTLEVQSTEAETCFTLRMPTV